MRTIAFAIVLCGCAGDVAEPEDAADRDVDAADVEPAPEAELIGTWGIELPTGCLGGYRFRADATFTRSLVCPGPDGEILAEQERGMFHVDDEDLYLAVEESSCPESATPMSYVSYEVLGDSLRLYVDATTFIFERLPEGEGGGGGSGIIETGCLHADGTFEPMPLQRL